MKISKLKPIDESFFNAFFDIYENALPQREQKSKKEIKEMCCSPEYSILLAMKDNIVIGFSIVFIPKDESFCLLEYMAIDKGYQNLGYGQALFIQSYNHISKKSHNIFILIEIDSDRENSSDKVIRIKRQRFYRRLGCLRICSLDYILALPGIGNPPQMDLLIYHPNNIKLLTKPELLHWLKIIYQKVYHCSSEDKRIYQMVEHVPDPVVLD